MSSLDKELSDFTALLMRYGHSMIDDSIEIEKSVLGFNYNVTIFCKYPMNKYIKGIIGGELINKGPQLWIPFTVNSIFKQIKESFDDTRISYANYKKWGHTVAYSFTKTFPFTNVAEFYDSYSKFVVDNLDAITQSSNIYSIQSPSNANSIGRTVTSNLKRYIPNIDSRIKCPECIKYGTVINTIIHLNDGHKKSRKDIADWLESLDLDLQFKKPEPKKMEGARPNKVIFDEEIDFNYLNKANNKPIDDYMAMLYALPPKKIKLSDIMKGITNG